MITGCPRTGTSALAKLLSTHDRICIFNEFSLYHPPVMELNAWHRISKMRDDNPPPIKISCDVESLRSRLVADLPSTSSNEATRDWLFGLLRNPVAVYGDKMPYVYLGSMEEIAKRFPGAQFILTLRADPPAPCLEVRYEQATRSPDELARKICDFVGMDYRQDEFQEFLDGYHPIHTEAWREEVPDLEVQLSDEFRVHWGSWVTSRPSSSRCLRNQAEF